MNSHGAGNIWFVLFGSALSVPSGDWAAPGPAAVAETAHCRLDPSLGAHAGLVLPGLECCISVPPMAPIIGELQAARLATLLIQARTTFLDGCEVKARNIPNELDFKPLGSKFRWNQTATADHCSECRARHQVPTAGTGRQNPDSAHSGNGYTSLCHGQIHQVGQPFAAFELSPDCWAVCEIAQGSPPEPLTVDNHCESRVTDSSRVFRLTYVAWYHPEYSRPVDRIVAQGQFIVLLPKIGSRISATARNRRIARHPHLICH